MQGQLLSARANDTLNTGGQLNVRPLILLIAFGAAPTVLAEDLYVETGFGVASIRNGAPVFGAGVPSSPGYGLAMNVTVGYSLMPRFSDFQVHIGLHDRLVTGSADEFFGLNVPYPIVRFEVWRFLVGGGYSPFVFYSPDDPFAVSYKRAQGAQAFMIEGALLWKVVPYFHFAIGAAAQFVKTSAGLGPSPALDGGMQMRFILNYEERSSGGKRDYDGWRYPFGIGKW